MKHLTILSQEELTAVQKFQEYGTTINIGYGNKATWADLVHSSAYSDAALTSELTKLKSRVSNEEELEDEDLGTAGSNIITTERDGAGKVVAFYSKDFLNVVRAARKVRKYFKELAENEKIEAALEKEIAALEKRTTTPTERLAKAKADLARRRGEVIDGAIDAGRPEALPDQKGNATA